MLQKGAGVKTRSGAAEVSKKRGLVMGTDKQRRQRQSSGHGQRKRQTSGHGQRKTAATCGAGSTV